MKPLRWYLASTASVLVPGGIGMVLFPWLVVVLLGGLPLMAAAQPSSEHFFRRSLADLGLSPVQLAYSDRVDQHVEFSARADHVLTAAELSLGFDPAVASSVLVTWLTDLIGFLAFLGIATLILLH